MTVDVAYGRTMREPPHNMAAEQALLGAILVNNAALRQVEEFLTETHFADPVHGRIYSICRRLVGAGRVADSLTLKAELEHNGILEECGGFGYVCKLVTCMVGIITARDYGRVIREAWVRRTLAAEMGDVVESCYTPPPEGAAAILEAAESVLLRIAQEAGDDRPTISLGSAVDQALEGTAAAIKRGDGLAGIDTGYHALNRMLGGLQADNMALLGARPSMGKTALGFGIAVRAAALGKRVLYWSGEMSAPQLGARAAAAMADLDTVSVFTGRKLLLPEDLDLTDRTPLTDADWQALHQAQRAAARLPLEIDDRPALTVAALRGRARRLARQKGGLGLIVVDYVQLMRASDVARRGNRYEQITEISADLAALAKELHVPLLCMVQLSRASEAREDKAPVMSDMRDSGALEQDASVVMLVHRPHYYLSRAWPPDKQPKETQEAYADRCSDLHMRTRASVGVAEIHIPKNRHGPTGATRLRFQDRTTWFRDETEDHDSPAWAYI